MLRLPKVNDIVQCPSDRGIPSYMGKIDHIESPVKTNINGVKYVWCHINDADGNKAVWPSHRLGYTIP